jgi:hypothetical protein
MALIPILENWRNGIQNLQQPTLQSIKQLTQNTQGQIAAELGINLQQLAILSAYLNVIHLDQIFEQFVQNEQQGGVENQVQAQANAAVQLRDSIEELLNGIVGGNDDNMAQDGGRVRRRRTRGSKKTRRTTRRR